MCQNENKDLKVTALKAKPDLRDSSSFLFSSWHMNKLCVVLWLIDSFSAGHLLCLLRAVQRPAALPRRVEEEEQRGGAWAAAGASLEEVPQG